MKSDSVPAFALEKEALKTEIEAGIQTGVEQMESGQKGKKPVEKYHNTRHLLRQYRKVAYAVEISETDMNVRMDMEHGISDADHTLVIGQLDLEVVSDINHTATQPFELPVNIDDISDLKIERIVVVGQRHVSGRKVDAHNRFPGLTSAGSRH